MLEELGGAREGDIGCLGGTAWAALVGRVFNQYIYMNTD